MLKRNGIISLPLFVVLLFVLLVACSCSCKPVINSFKVTIHDTTQVRRMTADDTLKVNWDVKGKPTLLVHETQQPDSTGKILEMTLVVTKNGKEANQSVQVEVLPPNAATTITFNTHLKGDTLVAEGIKSPGVWGDRFEIASITNTTERPLQILHAGRSTTLNKNSASNVFAGTPVEGSWRFTSMITLAEKNDHSLLPERLQINTTIIYKRR